MYSQRVYSATFSNVTLGTAAQSILEVQVPSTSLVVVLRAWLGADIGASPVDEVVNIALYGNDAAATGGTGMTEQALTPTGAGDASNCTALVEPTIGATPLDLIVDSFHLQNGWLYLPVPDERPVLFGGSANPGDNIGIRLVTAAAAAWVGSGGIVWMETTNA